MTQSAQWIEATPARSSASRPSRRLSSFRFLLRYPVFLLAFGPPQFKGPEAYGDTSQAHVGLSSAIAVAWVLIISSRAIYRLIFSKSLPMPRPARSIVKYAVVLGLLFVLSVAYSPGRAISAEMSILYFLDLFCLIEFLVDIYWNPPNWLQCLFELRFISVTLLFIVFICIPVHPTYVLNGTDGGVVRLMGGAVAPLGVICPVIAIISAYTFIHSLESKTRSVLNFLLAVVALAGSQIRGAELSLLCVLALVAIFWARSNKRGAALFVAGGFAMALIVVGVAAIGGDRIWNAFKRGQDTSDVLSGSGRMEYAQDVVEYTLSHPQGMGYVSGIRAQRFGKYKTELHSSLNSIGGTDDAYMQTLTDVGFASLAIYLIYLGKVFALGLRWARKRLPEKDRMNTSTQHALRCALLVFFYFVIEAIESSSYVLPLRQEFYYQTAVIAVIVGASTSLLIASRSRAGSRSRAVA